jgi:hypothetical protein
MANKKLKDFHLLVKALGPILLALWLLLWYFYDFKSATFCVLTSVALAAIVIAWIDFVLND